MALKNNYNFKISYSLGRYNEKENFVGILTDEQITQLDNSIEKSFIIQDAYYKINSVSGNKDKLDINLGIYKDYNKKTQIANKTYNFVPSVEDKSENFIKQGYEYLKTLDEYKDAIDLLDEGQASA